MFVKEDCLKNSEIKTEEEDGVKIKKRVFK